MDNNRHVCVCVCVSVCVRACACDAIENTRWRPSWSRVGWPMTGCTVSVCHSTALSLRVSWSTGDCSTCSVRKTLTSISTFTTSFTSRASYTAFSYCACSALIHRYATQSTATPPPTPGQRASSAVFYLFLLYFYRSEVAMVQVT